MARIVLMHADCTIRLVLQQLLSDDGHDIYPVENGDEAIRTFASTMPDLAILGFVIQKPSKEQIYAYLRQGFGLQNLPVVWLQSSMSRRVISGPADLLRVVLEPFDLAEIQSAVEELLPTPVYA